MPVYFWILFAVILACWIWPIWQNKINLCSPLTFFGIYFFYYTIAPYFSDKNEMIQISSILSDFYLYALLNFIFIIIGFQVKFHNVHFKNYNTIFDTINIRYLGLIFFAIGICSYFITEGFNLSLFSIIEYKEFDENASYNHASSYLGMLTSLFCAANILLYLTVRKNKKNIIYLIIVLIFTFLIYIIGGFRYRILILIISFFSFVYLYSKKIKLTYFLIVIPVGITIIYLFAIMGVARSYGQGLDLEKVETIQSTEDIRLEGENYSVVEYSARVIKAYSNPESRIYFEPLTTAIMMPIPRAIFPEKPKGYYLRTASIKTGYEISRGMAFTNFTEAYISFGVWGVMINGFLIGLISKLFWSNFRYNSRKKGAVILLCLFNGFAFVVISRGYLAQQFLIFIYFVIMPFWITQILKRVPYLKEYLRFRK